MAATAIAPETRSPAAESTTQRVWAASPIARRLAVLSAARHQLAAIADQFADAISSDLIRTRADTYAAEILPLLAACRFLEREATHILGPRHLGRPGLPFWLAGIVATVERVPFGAVLIIGPSNYPLFLPGVQTLQALAAGNSVVWKPGRGGCAVAELFRTALLHAGLPPDLLRITADSTEAAIDEIDAHPAKIFFTGSSTAGRAILHRAADHAIPVVAELSGCDAVVVLPSADPKLVVEALCFGMRLNGSATCMAPRRLILLGKGHEKLLSALENRFAAMDPIEIPAATRGQMLALLDEARGQGATICGNPGALSLKPVLILDGDPEMQVAQADIFAPILTVLSAANMDEVVRFEALCPYGLTVAIFGAETDARALGQRLTAGTILINDLIVPTADPRVPFGGRRGSGFGATRGREGLLEMTAPKVTSSRSSPTTRHYQETGAAHEELFRAAIALAHSPTLRKRFAGLRKLVTAARNLK
jgi:aldehyde dehydrogenase (NAD+)